MAKIIAKNKQYTGISAGVNFVNGVGVSDDPYLLSWFCAKGYTVESAKSENHSEEVQLEESKTEKIEKQQEKLSSEGKKRQGQEVK